MGNVDVDKDEIYIRTEAVIGHTAIERLQAASVIVFGIGGVGGHCAEALARAGFGRIGLVDSDRIEKSNINRQLVATNSSLNRLKTEVMKERINDINPTIHVDEYPFLYLSDTMERINISEYDYVIDAIDNVTAKLLLIRQCNDKRIPIICSMGTGNKLDAMAFEVTDIYKTSVCPLAKVIRTECRKQGIKRLKVVYSREEPVRTGSRTPGSLPYVPAVAGLIMAGEVIKDVIGEDDV